MTTVDGTDEPITAVEPATRHESLEHWLRDLRADLSNDPPGWLHTDGISDAGISDAPSQPSAPPAVDDENRPAAAQTAGRHRANHQPSGLGSCGGRSRWQQLRCRASSASKRRCYAVNAEDLARG